ncbi:hypothetical protein L5515_006121 [Caenorhabditis briggsae]|uniref:7TM GPCR serpentine receptor class x (Srx) domain-containing protein n=1 Tax=Caenorhabditis briggsae TaxID=6238 RepID=A0AAE9JJK8_CAEBR|nr:hypothetical protein L5515_006121 [Caenorhabditis briggsae]
MSFLLSTLYNVDLLAYGGLVETADEMFIWALALTFIPFAINGVTFMKFWQIRRRSTRDAEKWKLAKRNMIQFVQTVFQDSITIVHHRLWYFLCQTFVWQTLHTLDGFIMTMFNDKLTLLRKSIIARISPAHSHQAPRADRRVTPPTAVVS